MRTQYLTLFVGLFIWSIGSVFGFPFRGLTLQQQLLHCFLFRKAQEIYGTPDKTGTNANIFTVAFEVIFRGDSMPVFYYVKEPIFVSGSQHLERMNVHFNLGCRKCSQLLRLHLVEKRKQEPSLAKRVENLRNVKPEEKEKVGRLLAEKESELETVQAFLGDSEILALKEDPKARMEEKNKLTHSEFNFLCFFFGEIEEIIENVKKPITSLKIHGFTIQDMCDYCFCHMNCALEVMRRQHPTVDFGICISSLFDYFHPTYSCGTIPPISAARCVLLRKEIPLWCAFKIKNTNFVSKNLAMLETQCPLAFENVFEVNAPIVQGKETQTQKVLKFLTEKTIPQNIPYFTGFTSVREDTGEDKIKVKIHGARNIDETAEYHLGSFDRTACHILKHYCLGISNPLEPLFAGFLDDHFRNKLEFMQLHPNCITELPAHHLLPHLIPLAIPDALPVISSDGHSPTAAAATATTAEEPGIIAPLDKKETGDDDDDDDD